MIGRGAGTVLEAKVLIEAEGALEVFGVKGSRRGRRPALEGSEASEGVGLFELALRLGSQGESRALVTAPKRR
jgi:hypothetical protein